MVNDIKAQFPQGVQGPFFNDRFGDVYGNIYAFTSDGLTPRQLRDYVEDVRTKILTVPNAGKVDLVGAQDEAIYLEFSTRQIAALGLNQQAIVASLQAQNAITPSGVIQSGPERISVRVGGQFTSEDSLRAINLRVNDRFFRLSDVATITRGYVDPPAALFRFNGQDAIGLAIGMKPNANLLKFGEALHQEMNKVLADLPVGVGVHLVADQPVIVEEAVSGFTRALFEAVAIVLAVSFISLGMRAGFVVALSIPLVLAITFTVMEYLGISLQRISLGALIISLGLLVDDAMIAVEMMVARLEVGDNLRKAATYVYTSTAFPMLTGTLVTVAGFIPIGLNNSAAGEYTFTLFVVIAVSLLVSWIVAVLFAPLLGVTILPATMKTKHHDQPGRLTALFRRVLVGSVRHHWLTIIATVLLFAASIAGFGLVQQQFFPPSDRPELIVDWNLPQNSSIADTRDQMERFEQRALVGNPDIDHFSSYIGQGAVRFVLAYDVQPANPYFGQTVIVTKSIEARNRVKPALEKLLREEFVGTDAFVKPLELGPPVGRPVQYRVGGPDIQTVRGLAQQFAGIISTNPKLAAPTFDWNEPQRVLRVDVLQDKARQLGITSSDIASALNSTVGGATITQVRDATYLINVVARSRDAERGSIETLQNMQLPTSTGEAIPLAAVANFRYDLEQPTVWRRDRIPTITVRAGLVGDTLPATVVNELKPSVDAFIAKLPPGYSIETAGSVEESGKSQGPIAAVVPLMLFVMATILMVQLQSFQRLFLVVAVAPLGLIGVVAALVPSGAPLGFVAILGVLALIGILIRNSVILIVQIEDLVAEGKDRWAAVIEATEHRMRPIALTAAAASLALIPIAREVFWGPMAYAMMGGIIAGTAITLLFLPALYVAWFRIKEPQRFFDAALRLGEEVIDGRQQRLDQYRQHGGGPLGVEEIGPIGAEKRWERPGYPDDTPIALKLLIDGTSREFARKSSQLPAVLRKALLSDMEGHHRIAVGRDDFGASLDEGAVGRDHSLRRLHQRQRGPFGLAERSAHALEFAAHPAIEHDHLIRHHRPLFMNAVSEIVPPAAMRLRYPSRSAARLGPIWARTARSASPGVPPITLSNKAR
jgi:multidrug efflux pump subunit AcrB